VRWLRRVRFLGPGLGDLSWSSGALVYTDEVTSHAPGDDDTDSLILGEIPAGGGRARQVLNRDEANGDSGAACPDIGVGFSPDGSELVMGRNPEPEIGYA
jgi:hypothetical protein